MPKVLTPKRIRRSLYALQIRARNARRALARPLQPISVYGMVPRRTGAEWEDRGDDLDGGAGVREPRRPHPTMPAAALTLDVPVPLYLDLTR